MKYWWVNQGKTYTQEVGQDFMWSPITNVLGHRENSYDNMTRLEPGDLVFSHHKSFIRALGIVQGRSYTVRSLTSEIQEMLIGQIRDGIAMFSLRS